MRISIKHVVYLLIFIALFPVLTGCWSAHEISNLAIVDSMGIDETSDGQLEVTGIIVKPAALYPEQGESGNASRNAYIVKTVTGKNMIEIMGKLTDAISEQLYLGHLDVVVFGQRAAKTKMKDCIDFFIRGNDFRPNIKVLVAKGTAKSLISQPPTLNLSVGLELQEVAKSRTFGMTNMVEDLSKFTEKMDENTEDPYTGLIGSSVTGTNDQPAFQDLNPIHKKAVQTETSLNHQATVGQNGNTKTLGLEGTAVFKGSRLVGDLNPSETQGLMLLKGNLNDGVVTLQCGNGQQGNVGLLIRGSTSTFQPKWIHGQPSMGVFISVDADIGQVTCQSMAVSSNKIQQLNQELEEKMMNNVIDVLNVAQKQWQTDIFGFGEAFYKKNPVVWKQMAPNWRNGLLKNMEVKVVIHANINRFGLRKETSRANEAR